MASCFQSEYEEPPPPAFTPVYVVTALPPPGNAGEPKIIGEGPFSSRFCDVLSADRLGPSATEASAGTFVSWCDEDRNLVFYGCERVSMGSTATASTRVKCFRNLPLRSHVPKTALRAPRRASTRFPRATPYPTRRRRVLALQPARVQPASRRYRPLAPRPRYSR
jgi:hypothetical protein